MNLSKLLHQGYFPKELPPPFNTALFAKKSRYVYKKWNEILNRERQPKGAESNGDARKRFKEDYTSKYGGSPILYFSLAKGIFSRRKLGIPNPKQFIDLSIEVVKEWHTLIDLCKQSPYSLSTPVVLNANRSVRTKSKSWSEFKFLLIEKSLNKKFQLQIDISQFYPSIYTHSIPWAILGKDKAKRYFTIKNTQPGYWTTLLNTRQDAKLYAVADTIDTLVRNCNERQSVGLPIGPDTSFILAECIATRIDKEIKSRLPKLVHEGVRYFDDYYFYVDSRDDADEILKIVQKVLNDYQLETNESKTQITPLPFSFIENWNLQISSFKFHKRDKFEIRTFFSLLFSLTQEYKANTSWIVHYALGRFEYGNVRVTRNDWDIFLSLLLKTVLIDPSNLDKVFKIILSYTPYVNMRSRKKISSVLHTVMVDHLMLNHSSEVSWSLWILRSLKIPCSSTVLNSILNSNDTVSKIICLDIIHEKLYLGKKPGLTKIANEIKGSFLFDEKWLFAYETFKKGWVDFKGRNILSSHEFFQLLFEYDVSFYNPENQLAVDFTVEEVTQNPTRKKRNVSEFYSYFDDSDFETPDLKDILDNVINNPTNEESEDNEKPF